MSDKKREKKATQKKEGPDERRSFPAFLDYLYRQFYYLGAQFQRRSKRVGRFAVHWFLKPFRAIGMGMYFLFTTAVHYFEKSTKTLKDDIQKLRLNIDKGKDDSEIQGKSKIIREFKAGVKYIKSTSKRRRNVYRRIVQVVLPVLALMVVVGTANFWMGKTFALEIVYENETLGYVADESVFIRAQSKASERLTLTAYGEAAVAKTEAETKTAAEEELLKIQENGNDAPSTSSIEETMPKDLVLEKPTYRIRLVSKADLSNDMAMADALIDSSDHNITNAVGIYISGEFICAVKNETDALSVFDAILDERRPADGEGIVDFVEEVEYVHGLYPDSPEIMWDAVNLDEKLRSSKSKAIYHTISLAETVSSIAGKYNTTSSDLQALNPGLDEETIRADDTILVSARVNFLRVKITKTIVREEAVGFETVKTNSSELYKGSQRVTREGEKGLVRITESVSYVDGIAVETKEINRTQINDPISELITVGTKSTSLSGIGGSYTVTATSGRFVWPVVGLQTVGRGFGFYSSEYSGSTHKGIDIVGSGSNARGKQVIAADSGQVSSAGWSGSYGILVIVNHGGGLSTYYAHLDAAYVQAGQYVDQGDLLGAVGDTGYSVGAHLHFETRLNGSPVNPYNYLQ